MQAVPDVEESSDLVGRILSGRYRVKRLVRSSGMSHVYEGEDTATRERVAIKVMRDDIVSERTLCRFFLEARLGRLLRDNPRTVPVLDIGFTDEATPYLVMKYLVGEDLAAHLRRRKRLAPEHAVTILLQLCTAVSGLHGAGIVH